jgi:hypothetical protein
VYGVVKRRRGREGVCTVKRLRRSKYKIERKEAEKENMFGDGD